MRSENFDVNRLYSIQDEGKSGFMTGINSEQIQFLIKPFPTDQHKIIAILFCHNGFVLDVRFHDVDLQQLGVSSTGRDNSLGFLL